MQLGMVGLGRMGANMVRRLMRAGHECVVFDLSPQNVQALVAEGARGASSLAEFVQLLTVPRAAWVMVPAGDATESSVNALAALMQAGDTIIDGGNSYYKDDARRAKALSAQGLTYIDVGTSGGVWGLDRGYCLMLGGDQAAVQRLDPIFKTLAPGKGSIEVTAGRTNPGTADEGYLHCGPAGAGHFVKMVHNGIEYGLMQAYGEGFDIMKNATSSALEPDLRYDLPLADVAEVWRRGSVVSSWLLDLAAISLSKDVALSQFTGFVHDSGEGRWTVTAALEEAVPADVLTSAVFARFRSREDHTFCEKVLSAMRFEFGGHVESGAPKGG